MGWNINIHFLFYATERRMQYSVYITQKTYHLKQTRKKQGSHLARYKLTNKFSLFEPQSASLSKFEFEPKGSEMSSSWRRVRVNYEPSSTVVETISPKSVHFSGNICSIILSILSKMHTKEKGWTLFDNLVITYSPKENTQENHLPCLPPISLNDGRHKCLNFRQRLSKRA